MTKRQRIKLKMIVDARRQSPPFATRTAFDRSMIATLDCITDPELIAELDRIEDLRQGCTRLLGEVWNEYRNEMLMREVEEKWAAFRTYLTTKA